MKAVAPAIAILLCSILALTGFARAAEENEDAKGASPEFTQSTPVWQWSLPLANNKRAFLWLPPDCEQVRAIVVGQDNMIEQGIMEHPLFRATLAELGIAEVFVTDPFDFVFQFDKDAGNIFDDMIIQLAKRSGYSELAFAPVVPLGHSACASYPWNFAAWNPGRTLAVLSIHGDAPLARFTGSGRPNPDWGDRTIDGVPGLMVMAEYEWGDDRHGVDRLTPALEFRTLHPKAPIAMLAEPGEGHFNYSDRLIGILTMFIRKAAEARLPDAMPLDRSVQLISVDPTNGWLVQRWHLNKPRTEQPAPFKEYKGEHREAFWAFDKQMAYAIHDYQSDQPAKMPQLLSVTTGDIPKEKGCGEPVDLPFHPEDDGVTFRLRTAFMDVVPGNATHNHNAARWAYASAGSPIGHCSTSESIRLHKIVGPVRQIENDTFQLSYDRMNYVGGQRRWNIWVWANHPGDATYKNAVQQAHITLQTNTAGKSQSITFNAIPDQKAGAEPLRLRAVSDAGLKVYFYVLEGPAVVEGDCLKLTPIPPRTTYPIKVTVVAWQHGLPEKIKTAQPVARSFLITK